MQARFEENMPTIQLESRVASMPNNAYVEQQKWQDQLCLEFVDLMQREQREQQEMAWCCDELKNQAAVGAHFQKTPTQNARKQNMEIVDITSDDETE